MKKKKIFGIGAVVLIALLAAVPVVYGTPPGLPQPEPNMNTGRNLEETDSLDIPHGQFFGIYYPQIRLDGLDEDDLSQFYAQYETEFDEIEDYILDYKEAHGRIDVYFAFTPEMQDIWDTLRDAFIDLVKNLNNRTASAPCGSGNGGITKLAITFPVIRYVFIPGWLFKLWLNHNDSQVVAQAWELAWPFVILTISELLGGPYGIVLGAIVIIIVWLVETFTDVNINPFIEFDEGNGVFIDCWQPAIPIVPIQAGIEAQ